MNLHENERAEIKRLLDRIAATLLAKAYEDLPGLLYGNSGILLFLAYYSKYVQEDDLIYERMGQLMLTIFDHCNRYPVPGYFATGIAGVGWTFHHLEQIGLLEASLRPVVADMATHVLPDITRQLDASDLDALYGFIGHYTFLSACTVPDDKTKERIRLFFEKEDWLHYVKKTFSEQGDNGTINLGLAHGLASVGLLLCNRPELPQQPLESIARFYEMIGQQSAAGAVSVFPNSIRPDMQQHLPYGGSRYAWCYGDLGILYFFAKLKAAGKDNAFAGTYSHLADACNKRTLENAAIAWIKENECQDIGFCHGLAGICYLHYKINCFTPGIPLLHTNSYWLRIFLTQLDLFISNEQFAATIDPDRPAADPLSLLEGLPGAGLVLISYLTGDTGWDSCFVM